ncbi:hypothetical protein [Laspinema palackyanum]
MGRAIGLGIAGVYRLGLSRWRSALNLALRWRSVLNPSVAIG